MNIDNSNICDLLFEFKDVKNIDKLNDLFIEKGWNLIFINNENGKDFQIYFGKNVQVDNMYEYAFPYAFNYEETKKELERLIKYRTKHFALEEDLDKYIGRKINSYDDIYQFSTGKKVYTRSRCVGIVLGINERKVDMYDYKNPGHYKYYSLDLDDFKKFICIGSYKINYSSLSPDEKNVLQKYIEEHQLKTTEKEEEEREYE